VDKEGDLFQPLQWEDSFKLPLAGLTSTPWGTTPHQTFALGAVRCWAHG